MVKKVVTYETSDGKSFLSKEDAELHQVKLDVIESSKYHNYIETSWSGRKLVDEHSLEEYGIWEVRGEDPNPDMGGPHGNPYIATKEGILADVVEWAVEQQDFWTWGGGGVIRKLEVEKV